MVLQYTELILPVHCTWTYCSIYILCTYDTQYKMPGYQLVNIYFKACNSACLLIIQRQRIQKQKDGMLDTMQCNAFCANTIMCGLNLPSYPRHCRQLCSDINTRTIGQKVMKTFKKFSDWVTCTCIMQYSTHMRCLKKLMFIWTLYNMYSCINTSPRPHLDKLVQNRSVVIIKW